MIAGIFHEGSGLGDQLFRYITVRTLAEKKGLEWGMYAPNHFKGDFFLETAFHKHIPTLDLETSNSFHEKEMRDSQGNDVRSYDPEINFVLDNTIVDGSFEDDKYWRHNLGNISKWLAVEPLNVPEDSCVVGFRGGEYALNPELFLPTSYFQEAEKEVLRAKNIRTFQVHTDDPALARSFFTENYEITPNDPISHSKHTNMALNWRSARYSKYAIIPNSAFFILPRILKHYEDPSAVTIAPRYWARHNTKVWARPACYYPEFTYL